MTSKYSRTELERIVCAVQQVDSSLEGRARAHLDNLTKPLGSL